MSYNLIDSNHNPDTFNIYSVGITGWFVAVQQAYKKNYAYEIAGYHFAQGPDTINFSFVSVSRSYSYRC